MGHSVVDKTLMQCHLTKFFLDTLNAHTCDNSLFHKPAITHCLHSSTWLFVGWITACLSCLNLIGLSYEVSWGLSCSSDGVLCFSWGGGCTVDRQSACAKHTVRQRTNPAGTSVPCPRTLNVQVTDWRRKLNLKVLGQRKHLFVNQEALHKRITVCEYGCLHCAGCEKGKPIKRPELWGQSNKEE